MRKPVRIRIILFAIIATIVLLNAAVYGITYNHPLILGDPALCEQYREVCLRYSHELMADCLGIPAHAQIISIQPGQGEVIILLTSIIPPSRTKVWHSDGDVPYWE